MENRELTKDEILGLIAEFKSEIRKNQAKIDFFNEKIDELTRLLSENKPEPRKPYPLSQWDIIVLDVIKENGKPTASNKIYTKAMAKAKSLNINIDETKMKAKINQVLVKLSSRRSDLKKVKFQGRGYAYTLR